MPSVCLPAIWPQSSVPEVLGPGLWGFGASATPDQGAAAPGRVVLPYSCLPGASVLGPSPALLSSSQLCPPPPSWQADRNPNLLLTSPLQLSASPSKLNITHGDESPPGSAGPGGGMVCGRCWAEANARPAATGSLPEASVGPPGWGEGGRPGSLRPTPVSCQPLTHPLKSAVSLTSLHCGQSGLDSGQRVPGQGREELLRGFRGAWAGLHRLSSRRSRQPSARLGAGLGTKCLGKWPHLFQIDASPLALSFPSSEVEAPRAVCSTFLCLLGKPASTPQGGCSTPDCQGWAVALGASQAQSNAPLKPSSLVGSEAGMDNRLHAICPHPTHTLPLTALPSTPWWTMLGPGALLPQGLCTCSSSAQNAHPFPISGLC